MLSIYIMFYYSKNTSGSTYSINLYTNISLQNYELMTVWEYMEIIQINKCHASNLVLTLNEPCIIYINKRSSKKFPIWAPRLWVGRW